MTINYNELKELLNAIAGTDIGEFILKSEDFELTIRKGSVNPPIVSIAPPVAVSAPPAVAPVVTPAAPPPAPTPEPAPSPVDKKWVAITSPMVGTFYRAPAPDEAPFVEVNERVRVGQTVCIIEAMKLMNEIEAEIAGQIVEIAVSNGEPVEFGQTLMWVNPE
ncbi:acetyl-CoA carboxylase biotin carboxyl carrier protein [Pannus brasiliensis CCIBt3594]|uniref:Biotin carboxyl carrier protein of acetyl-CoA carboxylase n=1 Tax=Pannus brasiliensis CCIBt3594 TaxID=1427578 RepID=A0AAW9QDP0_9CHRO